jgi:hypothetical protein
LKQDFDHIKQPAFDVLPERQLREHGLGFGPTASFPAALTDDRYWNPAAEACMPSVVLSKSHVEITKD